VLTGADDDGVGESNGCAVRVSLSLVSEGAGDGVRCMKRP
jgi:hypothetical protein